MQNYRASAFVRSTGPFGLAIILLAVLCDTGTARAVSSVTQSAYAITPQPRSQELTTVGSSVTDHFQGTISYDQFDPSLGTLLSVELRYWLRGDYELGLQTSPTYTLTATGDVSGGMSIEIESLPSFMTLSESIFSNETYSSSLPSSSRIDWTDMSWFFAPRNSDTLLFTAPAELDFFTGTGSLDVLDWSMDRSLSFDSLEQVGNGIVRAAIETDPRVTTSLTYTYIPEPSAFVLVGLSLALTSIARRPRK
jgi:hypothetical protein